MNLIQLFLAGTGTTSTAIRWAILFLLRDQNIQKQLRNEIERVVGNSRQPSMKDREKMPYTMAFMTEVFRRGSVAPLGVPHGSREGFTYKGYEFPPNCIIIANLHSVNYDPEVFPDPEKFDPTRFLDENGRLNGKERDYMTFSSGMFSSNKILFIFILFLFIFCIRGFSYH